MGSSKRNLLRSALLLTIMGIFAVLTIFIVVDAINKKYYNDIKVEYEVQEESPNIILTFARNEGSNFSTDNTKVMLNEDKTKFRIDGTVPEIQNGVVTNLDELTSSEGKEFYFFSTNSSFIDPQEDPENPDFIFSETDTRYYVSTEENPIWYDVLDDSTNLILYSVFLRPTYNISTTEIAGDTVIVSQAVTSIPSAAFLNNLQIKNVLIPNTVSEIGDNSFNGCSNLVNVSISEHGPLSKIGDFAFSNCQSLKYNESENGLYLGDENKNLILVDTITTNFSQFQISDDCRIIHSNVFENCSDLESIVIPNSVQQIGSSAFNGCSKLSVNFESSSKILDDQSLDVFNNAASFVFPDSVTELKESDISNWTNLKKITIPSSIISIEPGAFKNLPELEEIVVGKNNKFYHVSNECLIETESKTLILGCKNSIIPSEEGITAIADFAFNGAVNLSDIKIPQTVTTIGEDSFLDCENVVISFEENSSLQTSLSIFKNVKGIEIPDNVSEIADNQFKGSETLSSVVFHSGVTSIGESAFRGCTALSLVTFDSSSNVVIGEQAFRDCDSLVTISLPSCELGLNAFQGCDNLTGVSFVGDQVSIGESTFEKCSSLATVSFEETVIVSNVGDEAFRGCSKLASFSIKGNNCTIGEKAFYDCRSLTSVNVSGIDSIEREAFRGCDLITSVKIIGSSVADSHIGSKAFVSCSNITSVTLGGIEIIEEGAFTDCGAIDTFIFTDNAIKTIESEAFKNSFNNVNLNIPGTISVIQSSTFSKCDINTITLGEGVKTIGESAITARKIYIPTTLSRIGEEGINISEGVYITDIVSWCNINFPIKRANTLDTANLYLNNELVTELVIPGSVEKINAYAFFELKSLTSLVIEEGVTSIGEEAFHECKSLNYVELPASLNNVDLSAFGGCDVLKKVNISDVSSWVQVDFESDSANPLMNGAELYLNDSILNYVTIPDSVTSIKSYAFVACTSLMSVTIPSSVRGIGEDAFKNCHKLVEVYDLSNYITISKGSTNYGYVGYYALDIKSDEEGGFYRIGESQDVGYLMYKDLDNNHHLIDYNGGEESLVLPTLDGNQNYLINRNAFCDNESIISVSMPEYVTSIGSNAFSGCSNLTSIVIPNSVTIIGNNAFNNCDKLSYNENENGLYLGNESNPYFVLLDTKTTNFSSFNINSDCKIIGYGSFSDCSNLTSITISSNIISIGSYAFSGCNSLTSIVIPNSVINMGSSTFLGCSKLKSVTFEGESQLTSIGSSTFSGCSSLVSVDFAENPNLQTIGDSAFYNCSNLTSIVIPENVTSIGDSAFYGCYKLVEVYDLTGPDGLNITAGSSSNGYVGYYAVEIKTDMDLTGIYYAGGNDDYVMYKDLNGKHYLVGYMGDEENLTLPTFDDGRTYSINSYVFYQNYDIRSVTIPNCVVSIGDSAFYDCGSLTSITIPSSVTGIESSAFFGCSNIRELRIDDLTSYLNISYGNSTSRPLYDTGKAVSLYEGEKLITNPVIPDGVTAIPDYAFRRVNITSVTIPESVTNIGSYAFSYCSSLTAITIPESVTSIGSYAFRNCSNLESVNLPEGIKAINSYTFYGCNSLTSITIPESVTSIGSYAFSGCSNIQELRIDGLTSYLNISYGNDDSRPLYDTVKAVSLY